MNRTELVDNAAELADLSKIDVSRVLDAVLETITSKLKTGGRVVLPIGTFSVSNRAARKGRNPQTGEEIQIKAARVAKFKAGKALKDSLMEGFDG